MVVGAGSGTSRRAAMSCGTHVQCSLSSGRSNVLVCKSWHTATSMHSPWLHPPHLAQLQPVVDLVLEGAQVHGTDQVLVHLRGIHTDRR